MATLRKDDHFDGRPPWSRQFAFIFPYFFCICQCISEFNISFFAFLFWKMTRPEKWSGDIREATGSVSVFEKDL